ncbi:autotransporter [Streptacidiphilus pinicola]|uniref:Autotransporter n=1 Tax=Streptacidiphilus pinicola TaxID=2219663 RepID=A0A2X0IG62_9ACTN|nr:autotransporter [Streptacidiphilus pinicola]RAG84024.1 autotransporter [Streptacidiphilus pinicola]
MARRTAALVAALVTVVGSTVLAGAPVAAAMDITGAILAGRDVVLDGDAVLSLPPGTTTYRGVLTGQGTLTLRAAGGPATLILTRDSDFALPPGRRRQEVTTTPDHPVTTVSNPDPPAVVVEAGVTLQYGTGGSTGVIGHYPYQTPGFQLNADNVRVDGTLVLDVAGRNYNLGTITGTGLVSQPRATWGTLELSGDQPFAGTLANGTGTDLGTNAYTTSLDRLRAVLNNGSAMVGAATDRTEVLRPDFYQTVYGNDINFHSWGTGKVVMTGVYSYADGGSEGDPALSDPSLNYDAIPHRNNTRGINIEGAHVQWGDGTTRRFFLPANAADSYINIHNNGTLAFDYDGPVTLGTPVSGGIYHNSLATPAYADVSLLPTRGNDVTFAAPQNYHGTTAIGAGAVLRLGSGTAGGDATLLTDTPTDRIVDDGALVLQNRTTPLSLCRITGNGSLTQAGPASTTMRAPVDYTGATTISNGTLALTAAADLAASSGVRLTSAAAVLDLRRAGSPTVRTLSGVRGSTILMARGTTLTVLQTSSTRFEGRVVGGTLKEPGGGASPSSGVGVVPARAVTGPGTAEAASTGSLPAVAVAVATAVGVGAGIVLLARRLRQPKARGRRGSRS